MANLAFYANEVDAAEVVKFVIDLGELAFIVSDGEGRWKAVRSMPAEKLFNKFVDLWHIPSGPLPLVGPKGVVLGLIEDPWQGWQEVQKQANYPAPWLGAKCSLVFSMGLNPRDLSAAAQGKGDRVLGRSDFGWHRDPTAKSAIKCWKKLKDYLSARGVLVDPLGWTMPDHKPWTTPLEEVALPGALAEIQQGTGWMPNPPIPDASFLATL